MLPAPRTPTMRLALTALPLAVQRMLARHPHERVRRVIASSPLTHVDIVDQLVTDKIFAVRRVAYSRTTNSDALNKACKEGIPSIKGQRLQLAMRAVYNSLTSPELLADALDAANPNMVLRAYCNPATPESARQKLTPILATKLIGLGEPKTSESFKVRAHELVLANPWMIQEFANWDDYIIGAFSGIPDVPKNVLHSININQQNKTRGLQNIQNQNRYTARNHPSYNNANLRNMSVADLIATGSAAGDIEAMGRNTFMENDARDVINRDLWPESHIIGRLVNRYGVGVLCGKEKQRSCWKADHFAAAKWVSRVLAFVDDNFYILAQDMQDAADALGDNFVAWEAYISLLLDWHDTYLAAAKCALRL